MSVAVLANSTFACCNAVRDEHLAMVDLYKALGGGWGVERE